jgi:hypothetical protein
VIAYCLAAVAELALADDDPECAARFVGASKGVFEAISARIGGDEATKQERVVTRVRELLGDEAATGAQTRGRTTPLPQMIAEALDGTLRTD